jgi:hypothetical protein
MLKIRAQKLTHIAIAIQKTKNQNSNGSKLITNTMHDLHEVTMKVKCRSVEKARERRFACVRACVRTRVKKKKKKKRKALNKREGEE